MPWSPYDLPHIVEKAHAQHESLIQRWQQDDSPAAARIATALTQSAIIIDSPPMVWMDPGICELLSATAQDVPLWSPEACMPGHHGLIGFETPFFTAPYEHAFDDGTTMVPVRALGWVEDDGVVRVSAWAHKDDIPADIRSPYRADFMLEEIVTVKIRVGTRIGKEVTLIGDVGDDARASGAMLQATVGAVWLLMAQPRVLAEATPAISRVRRRRDGVTSKTDVMVSVRALVARPSTSSGGGQQATTRWWVRGHWRQQAWGKGRKLRKPVFIQPHTAGATEGEVNARPQVQVWRG